MHPMHITHDWEVNPEDVIMMEQQISLLQSLYNKN